MNARKTCALFMHTFGRRSTALYKKRLQAEAIGEKRPGSGEAPLWERLITFPDYTFTGERAVNTETFETVAPLLELFDDIKPFAHCATRIDRYTLEYAADMDPAPLFNLDPSGTTLAQRLFPEGFPRDLYRKLFVQFVDILNEIKERSLLGSNTGAYFAILRYWTGRTLPELESLSRAGTPIDAESIVGYQQVMKKLSQQLWDRFAPEAGGERMAVLRSTLESGILLFLRLCVYGLLASYQNAPCRLSPGEAAVLLSDEIVGTLRSRLRELRGNRDPDALRGLRLHELIAEAVADEGPLLLRYRFYRKKFVALGDVYGDCTASRHVRQLNPELTNIHWTVYAWLMNPYYRVLEVCTDKGAGLLKAHLTPLVIEGRKILMVDAMEAVPKLREDMRGAQNRYFDRPFFEKHAMEIFEAVVERAIALGRAIGAEAVYADPYSNALWVNRMLEKFPKDGYHISDVYIPFDGDSVAKNVRIVRESAGLPDDPELDVRMEIQAVNTRLMERHTRPDHKEIAVLYGQRDDWRVPVRGI